MADKKNNNFAKNDNLDEKIRLKKDQTQLEKIDSLSSSVVYFE